MTNEDIPEIQSIWDDARGYIDRGNYDKAIETYQYILISSNPLSWGGKSELLESGPHKQH